MKSFSGGEIDYIIHWKQKVSWEALELSVIAANMFCGYEDKCNIEGIKGLIPEAYIQRFHYWLVLHEGRQLKKCPLSSVTTDTSHIIIMKTLKASLE